MKKECVNRIDFTLPALSVYDGIGDRLGDRAFDVGKLLKGRV